MESGQVVENPMIGAIPSKNEVQRELDDLFDVDVGGTYRMEEKKQGAGTERSGNLLDS